MLTGITTKRELVDVALRELIRIKRKKNLFDLAGQIERVKVEWVMTFSTPAIIAAGKLPCDSEFPG